MEKILHNYELVLLSPPSTTEDVINASFTKLTETIESYEGTLLIKDEWGKIRLAYEINKQRTAKFFLLEFVGPSSLPLELERLIRIDNNFLRFLTVRLEENVSEADLEGLKAGASNRALLRKEKISTLKQENV